MPSSQRFIYIACPWGPKGGGMYKVADYLLQSQAPRSAVDFLALDTRGSGSALFSILVLSAALVKIVYGRLNRKLLGVHVNMGERLSFFRKSLIILLCRLIGLPVILHLHASQFHLFYQKLPYPLTCYAHWVFACASHIVVLGPSAKHFVINQLRQPEYKVEILINGVPASKIARQLKVAKQPMQILFLGNLLPRKGVTDLLHALTLPGFNPEGLQVKLAGGGDLVFYQNLIDQLQLNAWVTLLGWADQQQAAELMAAADILILPSYDEGVPLVILEALAQGVAVVCTPVGEIPHLLNDGEQACFVRPGDQAGIAACLQRLLADSGLREKLRVNGLRIYQSQFSMRQYAQRISRIHQSVFADHVELIE